MPNSDAMWSAAGATMVDETGEMNVKAETVSAAAHLRLDGQLWRTAAAKERRSRWTGVQRSNRSCTHFRGFSGSSGPSQSTTIVVSSSLLDAWETELSSPLPSSFFSKFIGAMLSGRGVDSDIPTQLWPVTESARSVASSRQPMTRGGRGCCT